MPKYGQFKDVIRDEAGAIVPLAEIEVRTTGGSLATIYSDEGSTVITQPLDATSDGEVEFYALAGEYSLTATRGADTYTQAVYLTDALHQGARTNWNTRADLVSDWSDGLLPDGTIVSDGTVEYVASSGASGISDLAGLVQFGDVYPDHFASNTTPGTTDMASALTAAASVSDTIHIRDHVLVGSTISIASDIVFSDDGKITAGTGATVTISGDIKAGEYRQIFAASGTGDFDLGDRDVFITWFGGGTTLSDNKAAAEFAEASIGSGTILHPAGTWKYATKWTTTKDGIKMAGASRDDTVIVKKILNDHMWVFDPPDSSVASIRDVAVRDLKITIDAGDTHTDGFGIYMNAPFLPKLERVQTINLYNGVKMTCARQYLFDDVIIEANPSCPQALNIGLELTDDTNSVSRRNVGAAKGLKVKNSPGALANIYQKNIVIGTADGIWFDSTSYSGNAETNNCLIEPALSDSQLTGVSFAPGFWFDPCRSATSVALRVTGATTGSFGLMRVIGCNFLGGETAGKAIHINVDAGGTLSTVQISSNTIANYQSHGILVEGTATSLVQRSEINGNVVTNCQTGGSTDPFVKIDYAKGFATVGNQVGYDGTTADALTASTANYGIEFGSGCEDFIAVANTVIGAAIGGILDNTASSVDKIVQWNNDGGNPWEPHENQFHDLGSKSKRFETGYFADLDLANNIPRLTFTDTDGTAQVGWMQESNGLLQSFARNDTANGQFVWNGNDGTTTVEFGRFDPSGNFHPRTDDSQYLGVPSRAWLDVRSYALTMTPTTVANLPSAAASAGQFREVSDATSTTFGSTVAGGGSNQVTVKARGGNWLVVI